MAWVAMAFLLHFMLMRGRIGAQGAGGEGEKKRGKSARKAALVATTANHFSLGQAKRVAAMMAR